VEPWWVAGGACASGADPVYSGRGLRVRLPPIAPANRPRRPVAGASRPPYEINPFVFSGLYGVPKRHFFPYPHLMTAACPRLGTPRLHRAPFASRRTCGRGAPACFSPPDQPIPTQPESKPRLTALQQLRASSIPTKGSHPSVTSHRRPVAGRRSRFHRDQPRITSHRFCKPFRMNVYELPFY